MDYPRNLAELIDDGAGAILFTFFTRPNSQTSGWNGTVKLYLPNDLRNPMNIKWDQVENGAAVGKGLKSYQDGGGGMDVAEAFGKGLLADAIGKVGDWTKAKGFAEQATRKVANPYLAMTFKSVGFRVFKMEFKFTPHTADESGDIDSIIKIFRQTALPGKGADYIDWPGEVQMSYVGKCADWLPKFKRSVITDLDVNYTGQGFYAGMLNGFPAETILTLEFTENELVYRDDIKFDQASY